MVAILLGLQHVKPSLHIEMIKKNIRWVKFLWEIWVRNRKGIIIRADVLTHRRHCNWWHRQQIYYVVTNILCSTSEISSQGQSDEKIANHISRNSFIFITSFKICGKWVPMSTPRLRFNASHLFAQNGYYWEDANKGVKENLYRHIVSNICHFYWYNECWLWFQALISDIHIPALFFGNVYQAPLLLTWSNFNPSFDK